MFTSWPEFISSCRSRVSALARSCYLRCAHWKEKCVRLTSVNRRLQREVTQSKAEVSRLCSANRALSARIEVLEAELARPRPIALPLGERPKGLQYGAGMIALCVNLASRIGFRPAVRALSIFFRWLNVKDPIPTYQSIRGWMQRLGLARLTHASKRDGGVWIVDHTNQIGQDRVLTILRPREPSRTPSASALRLSDMEVVALVPGTTWKRADVGAAYQSAAKLRGLPRAVLSDAAVELREPVETLGTAGKKPLSLRDLKHFLSNQLERYLGENASFQAFLQHLAGLRSALQQTELAHFIPPPKNVKARFMNLAPTLRWARAMLWQLAHDDSSSRQGVSAERLTKHFGWLKDFAMEIPKWTACHAVIAEALKCVRQGGIYRGAARDYGRRLGKLAKDELSLQLARNTRAFLKSQERGLHAREHLPLSTEVIESTFARYKQLIRQHVKWGLSSLLVVMPMLLKPVTATEVLHRLPHTSVKDVQSWVDTNLGCTFESKRRNLYQGERKKRPSRQESATTVKFAV